MTWGQTLVLASALLFACVTFSSAQDTATGNYALSTSYYTRAWIMRPNGKIWYCGAEGGFPTKISVSCKGSTLP